MVKYVFIKSSNDFIITISLGRVLKVLSNNNINKNNKLKKKYIKRKNKRK
jgi:hypothetical protein